MVATIDVPESWQEWGLVDPDLSKIMSEDIKTSFKKTADISTVVSTRDAWMPLYKAAANKVLEGTNGHVQNQEFKVPMRDGTFARTLLYKPMDENNKQDTKQSKRPLLVLIHGGGFCYGSPEMEGPNCIRAVQKYGCVALSVSYRLAPEHKFPIATDDCWDALKWIVKNESFLNVDLSKGFILGGTSAGGNIAIVLSHLARDEKLEPQLTGIYLNVPLILAPEAVPTKWEALYNSRKQNEFSPVLNKAFMDMYTEAYAPKPLNSSYIWSPILWPGEKPHANLPRTYFQICGLDPLRDEALIYERELRTNYGIQTKVDIYPGLPHMFVPNFPTHAASKKYPEDTSRGIGWLLGYIE